MKPQLTYAAFVTLLHKVNSDARVRCRKYSVDWVRNRANAWKAFLSLGLRGVWVNREHLIAAVSELPKDGVRELAVISRDTRNSKTSAAKKLRDRLRGL